MNTVICPRCWRYTNPYCDKCENRGLVEDVKLSKNFYLSEFLYSPTAQVKRIQNDAMIRQQGRIRELVVNLLQPMRDALGPVAVTSGFRSTDLNVAVEGSRDSAHLFGYAGDVQPEETSLYDAMVYLSKSGLKFDQVILEHGSREDLENDNWLHVGWKRHSGEQRQQLLVKRGGVYSPWSP
jgi:hypothetical protein